MALEGTGGDTRQRLEDAIARIEHRSEWTADARYIAPGDSPNTGSIADLSVRGWAIIYSRRDHGAVVWVEDIRPIFIG